MFFLNYKGEVDVRLNEELDVRLKGVVPLYLVVLHTRFQHTLSLKAL
jgi:hypothetical protein